MTTCDQVTASDVGAMRLTPVESSRPAVASDAPRTKPANHEVMRSRRATTVAGTITSGGRLDAASAIAAPVQPATK